jgi:hypothetical protein
MLYQSKAIAAFSLSLDAILKAKQDRNVDK